MINIINLNSFDDFNSNVILVNGLTIESIKIKYNWILNASVENAIIGEDSNGIVWYCGNWICGEWENGTWYSGNFQNGIWKNGNWYSYKFNKFDIMSENTTIIDRSDSNSQFINGVWLNGTFNNGIFGNQSKEDWLNYELSEKLNLYTGESYPTFRKAISSIAGSEIYDYKNVSTWVNGTFISGNLLNCIWVNGIFKNGTATNIKWMNGKWFNGTFNGDAWYDGNWYNGNFILGDWMNGEFNQLDSSINSRFGNTTLPYNLSNYYWTFSDNVTGSTNVVFKSTTKSEFKINDTVFIDQSVGYINSDYQGLSTVINVYDINYIYYVEIDKLTGTTGSIENPGTMRLVNKTVCHWYDGVWVKGQFFSGYVVDSNNKPTASINHQLSVWESGTWENGYWFGGHFKNGTWENGEWYNGIFGDIKSTNWVSPNYVYQFRNCWSGDTQQPAIGTGATYTTNNSQNNYYEWKFFSGTTLTSTTTLTESNGSGDTYWKFTDIYCYNNKVCFVSLLEPKFLTGDTIYVIQDTGYTNESYQGFTKITQIACPESYWWFVVTELQWGLNSTVNSGKIVSETTYNKRYQISSDYLYFHDFDFDFDYIINTSTTLVDGYQVRLNKEIINDLGDSLGSYYDNYISLPLMNLTYNSSTDIGFYDPLIYNNVNAVIPIGLRSINTIENLQYFYGDSNSLWGLDTGSGISYYYSGSTDYNPEYPSTSKDKLRIGVSIKTDFVATKKIRISDIEIRAFYSDVTNVPTWKNGNWYNGTWYNGIFLNGFFYAGLNIGGNFQNSQLGGS